MEQNPRPRRPRRHAAKRARLVTGAASVAATLGLTGFMAAGYAVPASTTVATATSTQVTTSRSTATQPYSSYAAQPSAVSSQTQTQSSGS